MNADHAVVALIAIDIVLLALCVWSIMDPMFGVEKVVYCRVEVMF